MPRDTARIRVLDADPELAVQLDPEANAAARFHAVAPVETLPAGPWEPPEAYAHAPGHLGLLVIDGLLTRDVHLGKESCSELLAKGDLLRPWDHNDGLHAPVRSTSSWTVMEPARLAVLDRRFASVVGRWPELTAALVSRTLRRSRGLATLLAIGHVNRVDMRLLVLFWHLADRWGRVTPEGVSVPLRLTHEILGRLVGAHRPSVTTALGELGRTGLLERRPDATWLLRGEPPTHLERPFAVAQGADGRSSTMSAR